MSQLNLNFTDIPIPQACLWESLDNRHKQTIIEALARLMIKAATPTSETAEPADD